MMIATDQNNKANNQEVGDAAQSGTMSMDGGEAATS